MKKQNLLFPLLLAALPSYVSAQENQMSGSWYPENLKSSFSSYVEESDVLVMGRLMDSDNQIQYFTTSKDSGFLEDLVRLNKATLGCTEKYIPSVDGLLIDHNLQYMPGELKGGHSVPLYGNRDDLASRLKHVGIPSSEVDNYITEVKYGMHCPSEDTQVASLEKGSAYQVASNNN